MLKNRNEIKNSKAYFALNLCKIIQIFSKKKKVTENGTTLMMHLKLTLLILS